MKKTWLIIEDNPAKANSLIEAIQNNQYSKSDKIVWLWAWIEADLDAPDIKQLEENEFVNVLICKTGKILGKELKKYSKNDVLLLLDIELLGINNEQIDQEGNELYSTLKNSFFKVGPIRIIALTSIHFNTQVARDHLELELGAKISCVFTGQWNWTKEELDSYKKTSESVINDTLEKWDNIINKNDKLLIDYFEQMSKFTVKQLHNNWGTNITPKPVEYLAKFLGCNAGTFATILELKENNVFKSEDIVKECIKSLSFHEQEKCGLSLMGALFICWAAYRRVFPEGNGDKYFISAIKESRQLESDDQSIISRSSSIISLQGQAFLKKTIISLFKLFKQSFTADRDCSGFYKIGNDLLKSIKLTKEGFEIELGMDCSKLQKVLMKTQNQLLDFLNHNTESIERESEHVFSTLIIDFYLRSGISNEIRSNSDGTSFFFSSQYVLKLKSITNNPKDGMIIGFIK